MTIDNQRAQSPASTPPSKEPPERDPRVLAQPALSGASGAPKAGKSGLAAGDLPTAAASDHRTVGGPLRVPNRIREEAARTFGADLNPDLHVGDGVAQAHRAAAVTIGNRIHVRDDRYAPQTSAGDFLLRHEMGHVAQKATAPAASRSAGVDGSQLEDQADQAAAAMDVGAPFSVSADSAGSPRCLTDTQLNARHNAKPKTTTPSKPAPKRVTTQTTKPQGKLTRLNANTWQQVSSAPLAASLFAGAEPETRAAAGALVRWLREQTQTTGQGGRYVVVEGVDGLVIALLDAFLKDVIKSPKLLPTHQDMRKKAELVRRQLSYIKNPGLGGSLGARVTVERLVTEILELVTQSRGHQAGAVAATVSSLKAIAKDGGAGGQTGKKPSDADPAFVPMFVTVNAKIGKQTQTSQQTFSVKVEKDKLTLFQTFPRYKMLATLPTGVQPAHQSSDMVLRTHLRGLFQAWLNEGPPLPSGTFAIPSIGATFSYTNDTISKKILDFMRPGSTAGNINKYAGWVIIGGGILTVLGFAFPPAGVVGTYMIAAGSAVQIPGLLLSSAAEIGGGYRSFSGTDVLNILGLISSVRGVAGAAGDMAQRVGKFIGKAPKATDVAKIQTLTGRRVTAVLNFADATADAYGVYLGSTAALDKLKALSKGGNANLEVLLYELLGDVICVGSGGQGTLGRLRSGRMGGDSASNVARNRAAQGGHAPSGHAPSPSAPGHAPSPSAPGHAPSPSGPGHPQKSGGGPNTGKSGSAKGKGKLGTGPSVATGNDQKTGKGAVLKKDPHAAARGAVRQRLTASIDALHTVSQSVEAVELSGVRAFGQSPFQTTTGQFPTVTYAESAVQRALNAFQKAHNTEIINALPALKGAGRLGTAKLGSSLAAVATQWKQTIDTLVSGLSATQLRALHDQPLLPYLEPLQRFQSALVTSRYIDLVEQHGTLDQKKEVVFYRLINTPQWNTMYQGCVGQHHTQQAPQPKTRPSSPKDPFPAPPPPNATVDAQLLRIWNAIITGQQLAEQMQRISGYKLPPGGNADNQGIRDYIRGAKK